MRIGIDLGGTKIEIIALSNQGKELFRKRIPTPKGSYSQTLTAIQTLIHDAESHTKQQGSIGIGIPGTLSPFSGKVKNANSVWLNGQPFDKDLQQLLKRPIRIANDANCMAVSEATDGAGQNKNIVLALILGTGCGSGIVLHGKVHNGANGIAGEWGHNPLPWQDAEEQHIAQTNPCYCGKRGCIEQFISGTGLCDDYQRRTGERLAGDKIAQLALLGNPIAEQTLQAYERRLAKSLASYTNILDPDVIILAGGVCNIDRLYQTIPLLMPQYIFGKEFHTPIKKAHHGDSSGVRGAAWLWGIDESPYN